ncbi:senescence-associated protein-domain-containing protein [Protomyces lactucae-debilis]|uniref:Senescence-associated protein-domain-containing protein n=1 Tax=Protomyces lactucae-debilis TaxID=2754530 RepID=A0A1Y2F448_PROLT|nr:senescence-associated protein-domain-containing protein [Protomyces lactucae-debilis]ORY78651.1 senescence-associated protein-domain-containing protein [Protomyces lactucae-debilis]
MAASVDPSLQTLVVLEIPNTTISQIYEGDTLPLSDRATLQVSICDSFLLLKSGEVEVVLTPESAVYKKGASSYIVPWDAVPGAILVVEIPHAQQEARDSLDTYLVDFTSMPAPEAGLKNKLALVNTETGEIMGEVPITPENIASLEQQNTGGSTSKDPVVIDVSDKTGDLLVSSALADSTIIKYANSVSSGLVYASATLGRGLISGSEWINSRTQPATKPVEFSPTTKASARKIHSMTQGVANVSSKTAKQIEALGERFGGSVLGGGGKKNKKQQEKLGPDGLPAYDDGKKKKGKPGWLVHSAMGVISVLDAADTAARSLLRDASTSASSVISHRYGDEAGNLSATYGKSVEHCALVFFDVKGIGRKALIKSTLKGGIKARMSDGTEVVLQNHVDEKPADGATSSAGVLGAGAGSSTAGPSQSGPPGYSDASGAGARVHAFFEPCDVGLPCRRSQDRETNLDISRLHFECTVHVNTVERQPSLVSRPSGVKSSCRLVNMSSTSESSLVASLEEKPSFAMDQNSTLHDMTEPSVTKPGRGQVEIHPEGDVFLEVGKTDADAYASSRLQVSSALLKHHSRMFRAMLSPSFEEGTTLTANDQITVTLSDDDPASVELLCAVIHSRGDLVPLSVSLQEMKSIAQLADKWDSHGALVWIAELWMATLIKEMSCETDEALQLLKIAKDFKLQNAFANVCKHIFFSIRLSVDLTWSDWSDHELKECIDELRFRRKEAHLLILEAIQTLVDKTHGSDPHTCGRGYQAAAVSVVRLLHTQCFCPASELRERSLEELREALPELMPVQGTAYFPKECPCKTVSWYNANLSSQHRSVSQALDRAWEQFEKVNTAWTRDWYTKG